MNVSRLIESLEQFNPDMQVYIRIDDEEYDIETPYTENFRIYLDATMSLLLVMEG
jgi:hypothetical protein